MTSAEVQEKVVQALVSVAPEVASAAPLQMDADLRTQVDLDSMDFLRFVIELHNRFGIEVPETDYQKLGNLTAIVRYVAAKLGL